LDAPLTLHPENVVRLIDVTTFQVELETQTAAPLSFEIDRSKKKQSAMSTLSPVRLPLLHVHEAIAMSAVIKKQWGEGGIRLQIL
jgi:hypothetical protein